MTKVTNGTKDLALKVYRPDIYAKAAQSLIADKLIAANEFPDFTKETGFKAPQKHFIDNIVYDGNQPNAYLEKFALGLKSGEKL
jgi:nitrate/nitrite transport system substrate-binding protein